jgi:hypothetical protein
MSRRVAPALIAAASAIGLVIGITLIAWGVQQGRGRAEPADKPTVTRTYFAENAGPKATGRVCTLVVASVPGDVSAALDCGSLPAESRIADLLEGAGQ